MSRENGNSAGRASSNPHRRPTADEIVRSILDDRPVTPSISPTGELFSVLERFHRNLDRVRRELSEANASEMSSGSDRDRDLRRRFSREPQAASEALPNIPSLAAANHITPPLPPLRSSSSRRGTSMATPSGSNAHSSRYRPRDRLLDRQRYNLNTNVHATFEEVDRNLEDANSHLRALIDLANNSPIIPPLAPPQMDSHTHAQDPGDDNRRAKRRKLDSDRLASSFKGFRYGQYGQVEPGPLKMEMVSCDGGLYLNEASYCVENILKDDASVYCTKGNRCNIVLRHQGATVFSLKELVIRAPGPRSIYSSPVREGMVFIAMNSDELFTRTVQYVIQYVPLRVPTRHGSERDYRALHSVYSLPHDGEGTNSLARARIPPRRQYSVGIEDSDNYRAAHLPAEFTASPPPFQVTTECSDDESDEDGLGGGGGGPSEPARLQRRRTPNRIGPLPFESDSSDDDDPWAATGELPEEMVRRQYRAANSLHVMTLAEAAEASQVATQEAVRAVGGEMMAPHAKFYIEKEKSKCTIRFDPPVSGRFILLKMWSPHNDPHGNIDIQAVVARGMLGRGICQLWSYGDL